MKNEPDTGSCWPSSSFVSSVDMAAEKDRGGLSLRNGGWIEVSTKAADDAAKRPQMKITRFLDHIILAQVASSSSSIHE